MPRKGELLVLSSSGADNITDVDQPVAHGIQLFHILDFEANGEDALTAGQVLAEQLLDPDTGGGHGRGHVQQQTVTGDAIQLQGGLKGLVILVGPADPHPAGSLDGMIPVGSVEEIERLAKFFKLLWETDKELKQAEKSGDNKK